MLRTSHWIVRILNWLNWGLGVPALLVLFAAGFILSGPFADAVEQTKPGIDGAVMVIWLRWVVVIIVPVIPLAHIILTRLAAMIESVPHGTALSVLNARRLQQIAWALMGINVLDLAFGIVTVWAESRMGSGLGWSFTLTGWLAALMLLILARVFREGAVMREELEGTV